MFETIHRQCIESEQRCRDELHNGHHWLKDALPVSNQTLRKAFLLGCTIIHAKYLKMTAQQLQMRLQQATNEVRRLRT
jgi:hypothetical protein